MKQLTDTGKVKAGKGSGMVALFVLLSGLMHCNPATAQMRAGTGKANITADCGNVHDSLYVKALVIEAKNTKAAIITMDVIAIGTIGAIPNDFLMKTRKRIENELGISSNHIMVSASHNHLDGFMNGGGKITGDVEAQTVLAVRKALQNMEAVKIGAGSGSESRFAMNRRIKLKVGGVFTIRHANPNMPDDQVAGLGEIDPEIIVLKMDRLDGTTKAVLYNYACHPYTGVPGKGVTAEFPAFASRVIEAQLGHGTMAFFLQGAAGDITEVLYKSVDEPRNCEPFGQMLGLSTLQALKEVTTAKTSLLTVVAKTIHLPLRSDIPGRLKDLGEKEKELLGSLRFTTLNMKTFIPLYLKYSLSPEYPSYYAYRYLNEEKQGMEGLKKMDEMNRNDMDKYTGNIHAMEMLAQIQEEKEMLKLKQAEIDGLGGRFVSAELMGMRIGDLVIATFPGEAFARIGLDMKANSPFKNTFFVGYTNGYIHYAPSYTDYKDWGYEVTNCILAPEWQNIYEKEISGIIEQLK
jgi:hypothetical protein